MLFFKVLAFLFSTCLFFFFFQSPLLSLSPLRHHQNRKEKKRQTTAQASLHMSPPSLQLPFSIFNLSKANKVQKMPHFPTPSFSPRLGDPSSPSFSSRIFIKVF